MLEIDPSQQLAFRGPLTRHVEVQMAISNPTSDFVAYKIKTTAPKQYCVKPNSGRIAANSSVSIQVILQPMKEEPAPDFKCKDKFLIQSVVLTPETAKVSLADLWTSLENGSKDKIQQKKIRCVFLSEHEVQEQQAETLKVEGGEANEEFANASASRPNSYEELNKSQDPAVLRKELSDARETIQRMQRTIDLYGKDGQPGNQALVTKSTAMIPANSAGYPASVIFLVSLLVSLLTWYFT
ncbi:PapD-like protein [Umbelopsis sp. AD052]|nr:PapD-like protein [Umbelopsis sp. AD052]